MKRSELISIIEKKLPPFGLKYIDHRDREVDKTKDRTWLYRDESYDNKERLPEKIPADFQTGIVYEGEDGRRFHTEERDNYRKVCLEVTDYGAYGNTHCYGRLYISGIEWMSEDGKYYFSNAFQKKHPLAAAFWKTDLRHIVRDEDGFGDEPGYENGFSTGRFTFFKDLILTAAYVTLIRIEGPVRLYEMSYGIVPEDKYLIVAVDGNDEVTIGERMERYIK